MRHTKQLTAPQRRLLTALAGGDTIAYGKLTEGYFMLPIADSVSARLVRSLLERGYIYAKQDAEWRITVCYALTDAGRARLAFYEAQKRKREGR